MKKILVYILPVVLLFLAALPSLAQENLRLRVGWNAGMPTGDFKEFMGKNSFRGFEGELSYLVSDKLNIGLGVMYNDYYEKHPRQVYETKDGTISAVVTNSIQTTPILLKANYSFGGDGVIRPYVGLGAGVNLASFAQYLGEFGERKTVFKPAVRADAGVNIPFNREWATSGLNLGVNYNYLPFNNYGLKTLSNWGVHLGVYFPLR